MEELTDKLGKIIISFSGLEFILSAIISRLISEDIKIGTILVSEMSFKNLVNAFSSLVKYEYENKTEIINKANIFCKNLYALEEFRNIYMHSYYFFINKDLNNPESIKITAKQKNGLKINNTDINASVLDSNICEISSLSRDLNSFFVELFPGEELKLG